MSTESESYRTRRLIEDWLPIAELSEECVRERRSLTSLPPTYYLHVWFARRPLIVSRAAVLASLLETNVAPKDFLRRLGILGDPVATRKRIERAKQNIDPETGERENLGTDLYGYPRAFQFSPDAVEPTLTVLDPTAGGGNIPFEAVRLGCNVVANDLNPVAALVLKATIEFPLQFGSELLGRYKQLAARFLKLAQPKLEGLFPAEPGAVKSVDGYLWVRTVTCPYCGGVMPLAPNWRLSHHGTGIRLVPEIEGEVRRIRFEIVARPSEHSKGTVADGTGLCPFPDCQRTIEGEEIKQQAQNGAMGHELYALAFRQEIEVRTKTGKLRKKVERRFRAATIVDDVRQLVLDRIRAKLPEWQARNIIPDELFPTDSNDTRPIQYGSPKWCDLFNPRQLFTHCSSVEAFQELVEELEIEHSGSLPALDRAALTYIAFSIDKLLNFNSIETRWVYQREAIASTFDRHDFSFKWSYAEMSPAITGGGYLWAIEQSEKALTEILELFGVSKVDQTRLQFPTHSKIGSVKVSCGSADSLPFEAGSVDCVVMDPPYYDNVMYAELADFFYVWLKRTAGLLHPELFTTYLTDKDREAVANPAKFSGQKGGAKNLAGRDYQQRMAAIFAEQRRVLKHDGIMTVMFTHKAKGAWDALATGLIDGGFVITASWPVHTEFDHSLHIAEKASARSTILLVCRVRSDEVAGAEPRYWEDVEPLVAQRVRERVKSFQEIGLGGVDLYLACFGPALEVFSNAWPLTRGRARTESVTEERRRRKQAELFQEEENPYGVRPEDALEAARREVKNWRLSQLATVSRQHHLDPLTEWYMLAWDTFRAAKFDADEALKLARVIGLDFDQQVRNVVCDLKTDQVTLWDSRTRHEKGKLGHVGDEVMLDTLHWAALTVRDQNTGAAKIMLERANLIDDPTLKTALEAMLKVLPQRATGSALAGFAADFEALEKLRHLAFEGDVPAPPEQLGLELSGDGGDEDE